MHRPSGCPSCAEPLEEGDRFCGYCGSPVCAFPPPLPADDPTLALPALAPAAARAAGSPGRPPAPPWPTGGAPAWDAAGSGPQEAPAAQDAGAGSAATGWEGGGHHPAGPASAPEPGSSAAPAPEPAAPAPSGPADPAAVQDLAYGGAETRHDRPYGGPGAPGASPWAPAADEAPYGSTPPGHEAAAKRTCVACRAGRVDTDGYCEHCGHAQPRERDHLEEELGSVAAVSDRGLRHHRNEDSFAVAATALADGSTATVAVVCDGVSSASRPDDASAAAAAAANEALLEALPRGTHPKEAMHRAILAAADAVTALAPEVPGAQNAPACTLVGAVVSGGLLTVGWVGDSRAYWVPDDRGVLPRRLTEDDSWAAQMVAAGLMGEAEAYADARAHAITGWLGADAYELEPHTATFRPDHAGVVVVCTDGLWNYAESAVEMARVLPADAAVRPLHSAQVLVGHALDGGGHDNVTVAVLPFAAPPADGPAADAAPRAEAEARPGA
ncbi:PP2C family serine/threonine-protein phosphatase [Streptomyces globosus]